MYQEAPEQLERRLSELQSQIDELGMSLRLWMEKQDHLQTVETRLSALTEQCAEIVDQWAVIGERHAQAVGEFEERLTGWDTAESHVQLDTSQRMQELRNIIEHEWSALRRLQEEPVKQLREQAAALSEVSVAVATSAVGGFERAEARLAELETSLHRQLADLSAQVQTALVENRRAPSTDALARPSPAPSWPLEGVVRLHNQLRESGDPTSSVESLAPVPAPRELPETATPLSERMATLERTATERQTAISQAAARNRKVASLWWAPLALIVIGAAIAGIMVSRFQQQVGVATARIAQAERQGQAAAQAAKEQVAAARNDAARQIAEAREAALEAQRAVDGINVAPAANAAGTYKMPGPKSSVTAASNGLPITIGSTTPTVTSASTSPGTLMAAQQGSVTINGSNIDVSSVQVLLNGPGCTPCTVPNGMLTTKTIAQVVAPVMLDTAGSYNVSLQNGAEAATSNTLAISVAGLVPSVSSVSPTALAGTSDLTINGTNFDSGAVDQIYWKATGALVGNGRIVSRSANEIVVRELLTGAATGTYQIRVRNGNGELSNAVDLSVSAPNPGIGSISPASPFAATSNQTLMVFGSGFQSGLTVTAFFPNDSGSATLGSAQIQSVTATSFQIVITLGTRGTWGIRVDDPSGKQSNLFQFVTR